MRKSSENFFKRNIFKLEGKLQIEIKLEALNYCTDLFLAFFKHKLYKVHMGKSSYAGINKRGVVAEFYTYLTKRWILY